MGKELVSFVGRWHVPSVARWCSNGWNEIVWNAMRPQLMETWRKKHAFGLNRTPCSGNMLKTTGQAVTGKCKNVIWPHATNILTRRSCDWSGTPRCCPKRRRMYSWVWEKCQVNTRATSWVTHGDETNFFGTQHNSWTFSRLEPNSEHVFITMHRNYHVWTEYSLHPTSVAVVLIDCKRIPDCTKNIN